MTVKISASFETKLNSKKMLDAIETSAKNMTYDLYDECQDTSPYDTGYLQGSHNWGGSGSQTSIHAYVSVGAKYWPYLEFGTSKIEPRHWILNAMKNVDPIRDFETYFKMLYKP